MAYNSFPYTSMHELNLDYLLNKSKEVDANVQAAAGSASAAASSASAASESAESSLTYSRNSANSAAAAEASAADSAGSAAESAESARQAIAAAGDPKTFTAASQLSDTSKIYVYVGETGTYTYGHFYYYQNNAWRDGGVYGTWTTDNVLSSTSTNAVQNKVIYDNVLNLDNRITDNTGGIMSMLQSEQFDFTNVTRTNFGINDQGKWTSSSVQKSYTIPIPEDVIAVEVTANSTGDIIAFLNSYAPVALQNVDFSPTHQGRIMLPENGSGTYVISSGMNYLFVLLTSTTGIDKTPEVNLCTFYTDKTLSVAGAPADAETVGKKIGNITEIYSEPVSFDGVEQNRFGISGDGKWTASNVAKYTVLDLAGVDTVQVTANSERTSLFAFLNTYNPVIGQTVDFADGFSSRITIDAETTAQFTVTGNMNYLWVMILDTSGNSHLPAVSFGKEGLNNVIRPVDVETDDETGKTDMSNVINTELATSGYCHLAKGIFYIGSGIHLPNGSMLVGSGSGTVLKLLDSVQSGSTIIMGASSTVKDLKITGGNSNQYNTETGDRHGIEWTGTEQTAGHVSNCLVRGFSGSGIYIHDTTQQTYRGLSIVGCYITQNRIGIYIRKDSEFNKITACTIVANGVGYLNRGGNNDISCSGVDANKTGILVDDDEGDNGGHGTISGISVQHSYSNNGYNIIIRGTGRMLVTGCNLGYGKIKLENTNGNIFASCGFFRMSNWEINGGECSMFTGCIVRGWDSENTPVTITNNTKLKIVNCFDREGVSYEEYYT